MDTPTLYLTASELETRLSQKRQPFTLSYHVRKHGDHPRQSKPKVRGVRFTATVSPDIFRQKRSPQGVF